MYVNIWVYIYIHTHIFKNRSLNEMSITNDIFFQNIVPFSKSTKKLMYAIFAPLSYLPAY